jgi:hypothetical protein
MLLTHDQLQVQVWFSVFIFDQGFSNMLYMQFSDYNFPSIVSCTTTTNDLFWTAQEKSLELIL